MVTTGLTLLDHSGWLSLAGQALFSRGGVTAYSVSTPDYTASNMPLHENSLIMCDYNIIAN